MPVKVQAGVCKKVGLPDYGSAGASCHVEVEADDGLLDGDGSKFQALVKRVYLACRQAVEDELAAAGGVPDDGGQDFDRGPGGHGTNGHGTNGHGTSRGDHRGGNRPPLDGGDGRRNGPGRGNGRPATANQAKALHAIARRAGVDLGTLLRERHGVARPEDLSLADASALIDELKSEAPAAGRP